MPVEIRDKEHCSGRGYGEGLASEEEPSVGDRETCGQWQVRGQAGEVSYDHRQATWDEVEGCLQDPLASGWGGHACVVGEVLGEVVRYEVSQDA